MRDVKFLARMVFAFTVIVVILSVTQKWDAAETEHVRAVLASNT